LRGEAPEEISVANEETRVDESSGTVESAAEEQNPAEAVDDAKSGEPEISGEEQPARRPYKNWAFDDKLASHKDWIDSHGLSGKRADLAGVDLEAADLISVNLRLADLHDANLRAADLLLADLRDACLVRADLEDACLVGANLEAANLEGASLETAMGLVPRQIAGANLRDALLPPQLMEFQAESTFTQSARSVRWYFKAVSAASILSWLAIWSTRDLQLLTDASVIPFLHSHAASAALPTAEFYLIFPVALLGLYVMLHFHLQRLWDSGRRSAGCGHRPAARAFPLDESRTVLIAFRRAQLMAIGRLLGCTCDPAAVLGALPHPPGNTWDALASSDRGGCNRNRFLRHDKGGTAAGKVVRRMAPGSPLRRKDQGD
jgi:hypothetical protein